MSSTSTSPYLPFLPDDAFVPLPASAAALPGSPEGFRAGLFRFHGFGLFARQDVASRILAALIGHGGWAAVRRTALYDNARAEWNRRQSGSAVDFVEHSVLQFPDGMDRIDEGVNGLCYSRLLAFDNNNGDVLLWPTLALIKHIRKHG